MSEPNLQVHGLQFNSLNSPHLLASGGADSPVTIWNLTDLKKPTSYPALKVALLKAQSQSYMQNLHCSMPCSFIKNPTRKSC